MATPTYTPLATVTLGGTAANVTFSSIPATYRDLVLVINCEVVSGAVFPRAILNADTAENYSRVTMDGDGSSANSNTAATSFITLGDANADFRYNSITQFIDYSATDKHKTVLCRSNHASLSTRAIGNRWANTAAITSIKVELNSSSFDTGSTFNLYGIAG